MEINWEKYIELFKMETWEIKTFNLRLQIFKTNTKKQFLFKGTLNNHVIDADSQQPRSYWS